MEVVLISEELFKESAPIKDDTIITKFVPYISIAQKMYIEKILGRALVEELKDEIKDATADPTADPYPITPANQALLSMVAPALSFYAVYQGIPFHWASIVNKGITVRDSENSRGVDIKDIAQLRRWLKDDAEELARDLVKYLCDCKSDYPTWKPGAGYGCGGGCGENKTDPVPFDAGIFIPNRKNNGRIF